MHLLITTSTFPVDLSEGSPRFVFDLAKALTPHGKVQVLAPHAPNAPISEESHGVQIHRFRYFWPTRWQRLAYGAGIRDNLRSSMLAKVQVPLLLMTQAWHLVRLRRCTGV